MDKTSREKLTELIEEEGGNKWWVPEEFEAHVCSLLPAELKIVAAPPAYSGNYNCFVYAFGLETDSAFLGGQNPIQKEFVRHLLNQGVLEVIESPSAEDLVFYEDETEAITHGGIMQSSDTVISKWMWGATIVHKLWDVPSSFGGKVFYCKPVSASLVTEKYEEYKNSGVEILPIQ